MQSLFWLKQSMHHMHVEKNWVLLCLFFLHVSDLLYFGTCAPLLFSKCIQTLCCWSLINSHLLAAWRLLAIYFTLRCLLSLSSLYNSSLFWYRQRLDHPSLHSCQGLGPASTASFSFLFFFPSLSELPLIHWLWGQWGQYFYRLHPVAIAVGSKRRWWRKCDRICLAIVYLLFLKVCLNPFWDFSTCHICIPVM